MLPFRSRSRGRIGLSLRRTVTCLQAWFRSDSDGRRQLIDAMRCTLAACQPCVQPFAKDAIICIGDYGFVDEIWPKIAPKADLCEFNGDDFKEEVASGGIKR